MANERFDTTSDELMDHLRQTDPAMKIAYDQLGKRVVSQFYECQLARTEVIKWGKDLTLEKWLNNTYYGRGAYTLQEAAKAYYDKPATELTRQESMILAGTFTAPDAKDVRYDTSALAPEQGYHDSLKVQLLQQAQANAKKDNRPAPTDVPISQSQYLEAVLADLKISNYKLAPKAQLETYRNYLQKSIRLRYAYLDVITAEENQGLLRPSDTFVQNAGSPLQQITTYRNADINLIPYKSKATTDGDNFALADKLNAHYLVNYAIGQAALQLHQTIDQVKHGGYTITLTADSINQTAMQNALKKDVHIQGKSNPVDSAGIVMDETGAIRAEVGSKNYADSEVDVAVGRAGGGGGRSSGSSLKGIMAAVALTKGISIDKTYTVDSTYVFKNGNGPGKDWIVPGGDECKLLGKIAPCKMTLGQIVTTSSNTGAAQVISEIGIDAVGNAAKAAGIDLVLPLTPASILGTSVSPLGLATGMNTLVLDRGQFTGSHIIASISRGSKEIMYKYAAEPPKQVFDQKVASKTVLPLNQVIEIGTAKGAVQTRHGKLSVAGKTGTSADDNLNNLDTWFTGSMCNVQHTTSMQANYGLTASIWQGNPLGRITINDITSNDTAKLWSNFMNTSSIGSTSTQCDLSR